MHGRRPARADVVFVHGLGGTGTDTWRHDTTEQAWPLWLADEDDLDFDVWLVDYNASAVRHAQPMSIADRSVSLLSVLTSNGLGARPFVMVGHSLGGLVIKHMVRRAVTLADQYAGFEAELRGVVLFGTPNNGSRLADIASHMPGIPSDLVGELRRDGSGLRETSQWYADFATRRRLPHLVYREQKKTRIGVRRSIVVDADSSNPHIIGVTPVPLDDDHVSMCKIASRDSHPYAEVRQFVVDALGDAGSVGADPVDAGSVDAADEADRGRERALRLLEPHRLPRLERQYVRAIAHRANAPGLSIVVGAAGSGKSVALGQIARAAMDQGRDVVIVPCSLADGARSANRYDDFERAMLGAAGTQRRKPDAPVRANPLVLIDTIDLVLSTTSRQHVDRWLGTWAGERASIVVTCRTQELREYLEPFRERLPSIPEPPERFDVPALDQVEVRALVTLFLERLGRRPPDGHDSFAGSLLNLATTRRPMAEIARNPLTVGMICDLYGIAGTIPADLDVGRLYRVYWDEKIAHTRTADPALGRTKQRACLEMAADLWRRSRDEIKEWCSIDVFDRAPGGSEALSELLSEGVLVQSPTTGATVRFLHQTFGEFAMATYLAETDDDGLSQALHTFALRPHDYLHWEPVLREALASIAERVDLDALLRGITADDLIVFGVLAFASARGGASTLNRLVSASVAEGASALGRRQRLLLGDVLTAVESRHAPTALDALDTLLAGVPVHELARSAVRAYTVLRLLPDVSDRVAAFDRVLLRLVDRTSDESAIIDEAIGQLLRAASGDTDLLSSSVLANRLRDLLPTLRRDAFAAAIEIGGRLDLDADGRRALLDGLNLDTIGPYRTREAIVLAIRLARPWRGRGPAATAPEVLGYLAAPDLTRHARNRRASAVGAEAANSPDLLVFLIEGLQSDEGPLAEACHVALRAACNEGALEAVAASVLDLLDSHRDPRTHWMTTQLAGLIIAEFADLPEGPTRTSLRIALAERLRLEPDERMIAALALLADDDIGSWDLLAASVADIPTERRARTLKNVFGNMPAAVAAATLPSMIAVLDRYAPAELLPRVRLLSAAATTSLEARAQLLAFLDSPKSSVVKQVLELLRRSDASASWLQPSDLRPVLFGPRTPHRSTALDLLTVVFRTGDTRQWAADETRTLMADLLRSMPARRSGGGTHADEHDPAPDGVLENRLLTCCVAWVECTPHDEYDDDATDRFHARMDVMCGAPSVDPAIQRLVLHLVAVCACTGLRHRQELAMRWLSRTLVDTDPAEIRGTDPVRRALNCLLDARVTDTADVTAMSAAWTFGAVVVLLGVVIRVDPAAEHGAAARELLLRDRRGMLGAVVADYRASLRLRQQ